MKRFLKLAAGILLGLLLFLLFDYSRLSAQVENLYAEKLEFDREGNLEMVTRDRIATTNVTYKTIGWNIKKKNAPLDEKGQQVATIVLEESKAVVDPRDTRYQYTYFSAKKEAIYNSIGDKSREWQEELYSQGGTLFLDAIMTVCINGVPQGALLNGGKTSRGEVYDTYKKIAYARSWGNREMLRTHFNKQLPFYAVPQLLGAKVSLKHYEIFNGDYQQVYSLKGLGFDREEEWRRKQYSFQPTNLSNLGLELQRSKVVWRDRQGNSKTTWYQKGEKLPIIDNRKGLFSVVNISHYYQSAPQTKELLHEVGMRNGVLRGEPEGEIRAMNLGDERFEVEAGIPTGEALYLRGSGAAYGYTCVYQKVEKAAVIPVTVKVQYQKKKKNGTYVWKTSTKQYSVRRSYSYWTVKKLDFYRLIGMEFFNYALPEGRVLAESLEGPKVNFLPFGSEADHIRQPDYLPVVEIKGEADGDYQDIANQVVGEFMVRNDLLIIGDEILLDSAYQSKKTKNPVKPTAIPRLNFLERGRIIPDQRKNGWNYPSTGGALYERIAISESQVNTQEVVRQNMDINSITIHTPVVCNPLIFDEKQWNQELAPDASRPGIILGKSFRVACQTIGQHKAIKGYGYRDYEPYTGIRQVSFPFEVYRKDTRILPDTWINLERGENSFYLPTGVEMGNYRVKFRAFARNAENLETVSSSFFANYDLRDYCAEQAVTVRVVGRMYGFELIDIGDYPRWQSVFRKPGSLEPTGVAFRAGQQNENGGFTGHSPTLTLPMLAGANASFPEEEGIKTGYHVKFRLKTVGSFHGKEDQIKLIPSFYFVDKEGKGRVEVDVYYSESVDHVREELVMVGSARSNRTIRGISMLSPYSLAEVSRLQESANLQMESLGLFYGPPVPCYTYSEITLLPQTRIFAGSYQKNVVDGTKARKSIQEWYGEYHLPSQLYLVPKGTILPERIESDYPFLKQGYLIVKLDITAYKSGIGRLSYENVDNYPLGYCNMWKMEGFQRQKQNNRGTQFTFQDGEVFLYKGDQSLSGDFVTFGTH